MAIAGNWASCGSSESSREDDRGGSDLVEESGDEEGEAEDAGDDLGEGVPTKASLDNSSVVPDRGILFFAGVILAGDVASSEAADPMVDVLTDALVVGVLLLIPYVELRLV